MRHHGLSRAEMAQLCTSGRRIFAASTLGSTAGKGGERTVAAQRMEVSNANKALIRCSYSNDRFTVTRTTASR